MKIRGESIFNLLVLVILVGFLYGGLGFPLAAKSFPLIVAVPGVALSLWVFMRSLRKGSGKREEAIPADQRQRLYLILLSLAGMVLWIMVLGLTLGVTIFGVLFALLIARSNWRIAAGVGVFGFLLIWGLFGHILHFPLYGGLFGVLGS